MKLRMNACDEVNYGPHKYIANPFNDRV